MATLCFCLDEQPVLHCLDKRNGRRALINRLLEQMQQNSAAPAGIECYKYGGTGLWNLEVGDLVPRFYSLDMDFPDEVGAQDSLNGS